MKVGLLAYALAGPRRTPDPDGFGANRGEADEVILPDGSEMTRERGAPLFVISRTGTMKTLADQGGVEQGSWPLAGSFFRTHRAKMRLYLQALRLPTFAVSTVSLVIDPPPIGRIKVMDQLKGVAILLVVIYHAGGVLGWRNLFQPDVGVDIFVILSGIGLTLSGTYPGAATFLRRRLVRIFPTYWIALALFLWLNATYLDKHYTAANIGLHVIGMHAWFGDAYAMAINDSFWFITMILGLYLLFVLFHGWVERPERLLLAGAIISVGVSFAYQAAGQPSVFRHIGLRLPGFFLGLIIGNMLRTGRVNASLGAALGAAVFILAYVPSLRGIIMASTVTALAVMAFYAFVLRNAFERSGLGVVPRFFTFLGDHSLEIFLLHQPLMRDFNFVIQLRVMKLPGLTPRNMIIGMIVAFVVTLFLSMELRRLLNRIIPK